jgi:4-carboxymuconolactone decarboxylase
MKLLFAIALAALAVPRLGAAEERFAPLRPDQLSPGQKAWAESIAAPPRNAKFTNPPYRAYIRSPQLAPRLQALSDFVRWESSLPARMSEFAILITARQWTQQYEWAAHYPLALKGGLDPAVAADLAAGKRPEKMTDDEAVLYDLAMASIATRTSPTTSTTPRSKSSARKASSKRSPSWATTTSCR